MTITLLSVSLSISLALLALIHLNWVVGGTWGFAQALPTNERGEIVLNPGRIDSAVVGSGLLAFALFYLLKSGLVDLPVPNWILTFGGWIIPTIFLLRAMGDFRYIGFFKKVRDTDFGKLDSILFSPLCLTIGIIGIVVLLLVD